VKKLILLTAAVFALASGVYAASGDKTPIYAPKYHNISSSTKAAKLPGELRYSGSYLYVNISTAARPHWRRMTLGGSF